MNGTRSTGKPTTGNRRLAAPFPASGPPVVFFRLAGRRLPPDAPSSKWGQRWEDGDLLVQPRQGALVPLGIDGHLGDAVERGQRLEQLGVRVLCGVGDVATGLQRAAPRQRELAR